MNENAESAYTVIQEKKAVWDRIMAFLRDYEYEVDVRDVDNPPEKLDASITVDMPAIDFSGETLKSFIGLLPELGGLEFRNSGNDSILMKMTVSGIWEVVKQGE